MSLCILLLLSCSAPSERDSLWEGEETVLIAGVSILDDIADIHTINLLQSNGVPAWCDGGSIVCGIGVRKKDEENAKEILRRDAQTLGYYLILGEDLKERYHAHEAGWVEIVVNKPLKDILASDRFPSGTDIGGLLRHTKFSQSNEDFPVIRSLRIYKRQYLDSEFNRKIGHDVLVDVGSSLKKTARQGYMRFQVHNAGESVIFQGGRWDTSDDKK